MNLQERQIEREQADIQGAKAYFKENIDKAKKDGSLMETSAGIALYKEYQELLSTAVTTAVTDSRNAAKFIESLVFIDLKSHTKLADALGLIMLNSAIRFHLISLKMAKKNAEDNKNNDWNIQQNLIAQIKMHLEFTFAPNEWLDYIAAILADALKTTEGIFNQTTIRKGKEQFVHLEMTDKLDDVVDMLLESDSFQLHRPMICQPDEWDAGKQGGFLTRELKREMVSNTTKEQRVALRKADLVTTYAALNSLQNTKWSVNKQVLELMLKRRESSEELGKLRFKRIAKPEYPEGWKEADDQRAFNHYLRAKALYDTSYSLLVTTKSVLSQALDSKSFDAIYFPVTMDSRGRMYYAGDFHPQGNDLSKSLLQFASKKRLGATGKYWLAVHLANSFGLDKKTLKERTEWVMANSEALCEFANNVSSLEYDAETVWQAIAASLEWKALCAWEEAGNPSETFLSGLVVAFDASCSGIQHLSALVKDEVSGEAVNLVPSAVRNDIYLKVAAATKEAAPHLNKYKNETDEEFLTRKMVYEACFGKWEEIGVSRSMTKRPVMTLAYGATQRSRLEYIRAALYETDMQAESIKDMAASLNVKMEDALSLLLAGPLNTMSWIQKTADVSIKQGIAPLWTTPTGFVATVNCKKTEPTRIRVRIGKGQQLQINLFAIVEGQIDKKKARNAIAPGYIHSLDASHMMMVIERMNCPFSNVHDSFGCRAGDAEALFYTVREVFVELYEQGRLLEQFAVDMGCPDKPLPKIGSLKVAGVLRNEFCFS